MADGSPGTPVGNEIAESQRAANGHGAPERARIGPVETPGRWLCVGDGVVR
jgi:hypothetical protein